MARALFAIVSITIGLTATASAAEPPKVSPAAEEFFEKKVRPVLAEHCYSCHGEKKQMAGLRLDNSDGMKKGTDEGPIVTPGDPNRSKLVRSIKREGDYPMPPKQPLPPEAVAALSEWVKSGAHYPVKAGGVIEKDQGKNHWAFQPVRDPQVPNTRTPIASINPIDRFIQAKLDEKNLTLSPQADRRTLIRRVTYDLTGLAPTAQEIEQFEKDTSPQAYERLVDRVLASPHYGERWGRYWLDLARYADSKGYVFTEDRNYPYAYTYRDYVIRSLNEDKPFDRFVTEQIAADRLDLKNDPRPLAAMGFLTVGRRFSNNTHEIIDDRIDVVTRGLMGLTVQCARCHDHKFDPVPMADYYSLYGIFASSVEPKELPLIGAVERTKEYEAFEAELARREQAVVTLRDSRIALRTQNLSGLIGFAAVTLKKPEAILNRLDTDMIGKVKKRVDELKASSPFNPPRAMVMNDAPSPTQPVIFLRGNPNNRGQAVPRQSVTVASLGKRTPFTQGSGRLELAQSIVSPDNPLTARVFVNRVWLGHFGQGLVRTPSDFGLRSEPPTHPELLDWLAKRFVEDGWSIKKLHRRIVTSATYQQSSTPRPELALVDPENRLLAVKNRTRLDFEALRDSLLQASGQLDPALYGRSVNLFTKPYPTRRTIYASIDRQNLPGTFRAFDFANPDGHSPQRFLTTVPQQSLFLMNSPFVADRARGVLARPDVAWAFTPTERVRRLYRAVLGRNPTADEAKLSLEYVTSVTGLNTSATQLSPWESLAQVLLLSNEFAFVD